MTFVSDSDRHLRPNRGGNFTTQQLPDSATQVLASLTTSLYHCHTHLLPGVFESTVLGQICAGQLFLQSQVFFELNESVVEIVIVGGLHDFVDERLQFRRRQIVDRDLFGDFQVFGSGVYVTDEPWSRRRRGFFLMIYFNGL